MKILLIWQNPKEFQFLDPSTHQKAIKFYFDDADEPVVMEKRELEYSDISKNLESFGIFRLSGFRQKDQATSIFYWVLLLK